MKLPDSPEGAADFRRALESSLVELRPRLHRYCARMTGSVIDGEDVVQDTVVKALQASPHREPPARPDAWLFRIAHNAALDHLRRRRRTEELGAGEAEPPVEESGAPDEPATVLTSLETFMRLPSSQRCVVILMDVLGYSLDEIAGIVDSSLSAVKSALHRGRQRLRELAREPQQDSPPGLPEEERLLLTHYVDRFNARDFDALRDMLAAEVRLDLVGRLQLKGTEVGRYFQNYEKAPHWHFAVGTIDNRPVALAYDSRLASHQPQYFVALQWSGAKIIAIRDFHHARYVMESGVVRAPL